MYVTAQALVIIIIYIAGKNMFIAVIRKVSGATFRFYDVTPIGRLMNRMTSDISVLDGNISHQIPSQSPICWRRLGHIAVRHRYCDTSVLCAFALVLAATYTAIFLRFLPASQSLRRLEMVSLTPLMSNFGTLAKRIVYCSSFPRAATISEPCCACR